MDIFDKIKKNRGPLGRYAKDAHGYFTFPKLEGEISNKMIFRNKEVLVWSINNYLGLSNHPEVRKSDAYACENWGLGHPMGSRMMSGNTDLHQELELKISNFMDKEATILLNYGYQGMVSAIDALIDRNDIIISDSQSHACIIDGCRMHKGKRYSYQHNNIKKLEDHLKSASKLISKTKGGILVITEGVFGMSGDLGKLDEIIKLKKKYNFRLFVDDAHGFGTMGKTGKGTGEHFNVHNEIDVYFGTFAKSMSSIGGFICSNSDIIEYLKYNCRSQIFAKSLPSPIVYGAIKRLELIEKHPEFKTRLWDIATELQKGLRKEGFNLGTTESAVTPVILNGDIPEATNLTYDLRENYHIFCSIVTYPVVERGVILLRLIPTAVHTEEDVRYTIESFRAIKKKLENGEYQTENLAKH